MSKSEKHRAFEEWKSEGLLKVRFNLFMSYIDQGFSQLEICNTLKINEKEYKELYENVNTKKEFIRKR